MTTESDPDLPEEGREESSEPASLFGRLFNVYAAPGELFEELRDTRPAHSNWVVPLLLSIAVGVIFSVVVFSQPDIVASVFAQQEAIIQGKVDAGEMTQQQADQAMTQMKQFQSGKLMMIFGILGSIIGSGVFLIVVSAMFWLVTAKFLKANLTYFKAVEVVGLAAMVNVVGGLITLILVLLKANVNATPNPSLLLGKFDPASYGHQLLAAFNLMTLWWLAVVALGASKLARCSFLKTATWTFGIWALIRFPFAFLGAWWTRFQSGM